MPGAFVVVGDTVDEARKKKALLDSLVHPDSGLASLSIALGCDATNFELDGPLPEIPDTNASKSGRERFVTLAKRDNLTVRQLAQIAGSFSGLMFVGTPATIADEMEQWLFEEGCDGFNIMFPYVPEGLDDFVDKVVPELQRRGLFRREYEGKTSARESRIAATGESVLQVAERPFRRTGRSRACASAFREPLTPLDQHGEDWSTTAPLLHEHRLRSGRPACGQVPLRSQARQGP